MCLEEAKCLFLCVYVDWHTTTMLLWNWATQAFPHATFGNMPVYSTCTYVDSNMESTAMLFFDVFRTLERGAISTVGVSARPLLPNGSMFVWLSLCLCGAGREGLWHVSHARAAMATDGTWELGAQGMYMSCSPVEPVNCHFRRAEEN